MGRINEYEIRCEGQECAQAGQCQRFSADTNALMPWTPIAPNVCAALERNHFLGKPRGAEKDAPRPEK